jgi:hypothetical protein
MAEISDIINKEVTIGFGKTPNRIVVNYGKKGFTLYAGDSKIEQAKKERITTRITPFYVKCQHATIIGKSHMISFRLGQNRFLSLQYMQKDDLHVAYMPDEADLEYGRSPFMKKCSGRGLL